MTRRTCLRPLRGGTNFSTPSLTRMRPTLSLLRMAEKASTEAISAASSRLDCATEPNNPEPLKSTSSITVSSRSSTNFLMNGWFIRAVTFQSMERTSSPGWYSRTSSKFIRSEEHTSELQSRLHLVCRLLLEKKKKKANSCSQHKNRK